MNYLVALVTSGIAIGAVYGLLAMAFALIYKSTGLINFAVGEVAMIVAYMTWSMTAYTGADTLTVLLVAIGCGAFVGLVVERLLIRPMMGEPMFSLVLVTIGLAVILRSVVLLVWGVSMRPMGMPQANELIQIFGLRLRWGQLVVVLVMIALSVGTWLFFRFSRFGIAMRAVATDDRTALLMGVNTARVQSVAWASSCAIAGLAGVCFAAVYDLAPDSFVLGLKAFPAAILGGLDSVLGATFGGIVVGVIENLVGGYVSSSLKEVAGFLLIVVVLMIKPSGLFGEREIERV
jgi:branched-chain amino acid transport system permease protein